MTTIHVDPVTCGVCRRGMAPPGWPCVACAYAELAALRAAHDAALHALARCEAIALDECRTDAQVRADVADTAAEAYAPHVARVRELVRTPLPAHIRAGFRGELATAEGLHAAERAALVAALEAIEAVALDADRDHAATQAWLLACRALRKGDADAAREGAR